jgi:hypothetical protein
MKFLIVDKKSQPFRLLPCCERGRTRKPGERMQGRGQQRLERGRYAELKELV